MLFSPCSGSTIGFASPFVRRPLCFSPLLLRHCRHAVALLLLVLLVPEPAAAKGQETAASLFRQLPTTIFDNTAQPLSEDGKEQLLDQGYAGEWVIVHAEPDAMEISLPSSLDGEVMIRLYRGKQGGVIALGANSGGTCAAELWAYDRKGALLPDAGPEDPPATDFFQAGHPLPPGITLTTRLCLEGRALEMKPLFWDRKGPVEMVVDNRVFYLWDGNAFIRKITTPVLCEIPAPAQ